MGSLIMKYLCDTCILIDYLRGDDNIRQILSRDRKDGLGMSIITHMELMVGAFRLLIPDALIAATALEYNLPLFTSNISDFRFIPGINLWQRE